MKKHLYTMNLSWTGNSGQGTTTYNSYERSYSISHHEKNQTILGSSDPNFLGDAHKFNPEELLLSSISSCHMLWYLHLCSTKKIVVTSYSDSPTGTMIEDNNGSGRFDSVQLNPHVEIENGELKELAESLHQKAHEMCFIANSCNFPIYCSPFIKSEVKH